MLQKLGRRLKATSVKVSGLSNSTESGTSNHHKKEPPVPCIRAAWVPQDESALLSLPMELLEEVLFHTGNAKQLQGARAACVQLYHMSVAVAARYFSLPTLESFDILSKVGSEFFADVYRAPFLNDGKIYALKVFEKSAMVEGTFGRKRRQIVHLWQQLQHRGFSPLYCSFQDNVNLYAVTTFPESGFRYLSSVVDMQPEAVKYIAIQLVAALCYANEKGIVLRAITSSNVVLDQAGRIYLTEFSMMEHIGSDRTDTIWDEIGPIIPAPEVLEGKPYDYSVDWWALGVLLYESRIGQPPFYSDSAYERFSNILEGRLVIPSSVDGAERDILAQLLDSNPETRLQGQLVKAHPYFDGVDWIKVDQGECLQQSILAKLDTYGLQPDDPSRFGASLNNITKEHIRRRFCSHRKQEKNVHVEEFNYRMKGWGL